LLSPTASSEAYPCPGPCYPRRRCPDIARLRTNHVLGRAWMRPLPGLAAERLGDARQAKGKSPAPRLQTNKSAKTEDDFAPCASYCLRKQSSGTMIRHRIPAPQKSHRQECLCCLSNVHRQHVAVGEHDFAQFISGKADWGSILGGSEIDGDLVAGLDGRTDPAIPL
jgi:hypothetical protein